MRSDLFCQLARVINESYGWIRVSESKTYAVRSVRIRCRTYPIASRTLMLRAAFSHRRYPKGSVWQIAEHDLDKAVAQYRKQNPDSRPVYTARTIRKVQSLPMMPNKSSFLPPTACSTSNSRIRCYNSH